MDVWLGALQSRVPGFSALVVVTQTDRFASHLEAALGDLQHTLEDHSRIKCDKLERPRHDTSTPSNAKQNLIFHGVETISSTRSESLAELRSKLSKLVSTNIYMFPSVGRRRPVSWGRVYVWLDTNEHEQEQRKIETMVESVRFLHREMH